MRMLELSLDGNTLTGRTSRDGTFQVGIRACLVLGSFGLGETPLVGQRLVDRF